MATDWTQKQGKKKMKITPRLLSPVPDCWLMTITKTGKAEGKLGSGEKMN